MTGPERRAAFSTSRWEQGLGGGLCQLCLEGLELGEAPALCLGRIKIHKDFRFPPYPQLQKEFSIRKVNFCVLALSRLKGGGAPGLLRWPQDSMGPSRPQVALSRGRDPVGVGVRTQVLKTHSSILAAMRLCSAGLEPPGAPWAPRSLSQGDLLNCPTWLVAGERCVAQ